jgi:transcription antitermination factor NusG
MPELSGFEYREAYLVSGHCDSLWRSLVLTTLQSSSDVSSSVSPPLDMISPWPLAWFAVQTRFRYEKRVARELQEKGVQVFLPLFSSRHQWSDRQRLVEVPLFPSYVFVRVPATQGTRIQILRTNGVNGFLGARGVGTPIPDEEVAAVRAMLAHRVPFRLHPFLRTGQRVRIRGGCLDGIRGILTAIKGEDNFVVSVELIQRSIALRLTGYQLESD